MSRVINEMDSLEVGDIVDVIGTKQKAVVVAPFITSVKIKRFDGREEMHFKGRLTLKLLVPFKQALPFPKKWEDWQQWYTDRFK